MRELDASGATVTVKFQPSASVGGRFAKDRFIIDTGAATVICPAEVPVSIRGAKSLGGTATFGKACAACPLASACTMSKTGRTITISAYEDELTRARTTQKDPA